MNTAVYLRRSYHIAIKKTALDFTDLVDEIERPWGFSVVDEAGRVIKNHEHAFANIDDAMRAAGHVVVEQLQLARYL